VTGIIVNLLTNDLPEYYDIALRDLGFMLWALALTRLAFAFHRSASTPTVENEHRFRLHRAA